MANIFFKKLEEIQKLILLQKNVLNVNELHLSTGWSTSFIYKLTSDRKIPHYKPNKAAKLLFFKRNEIDDYMTKYKVKTTEDLTAIANTLITKKNKENGKY